MHYTFDSRGGQRAYRGVHLLGAPLRCTAAEPRQPLLNVCDEDVSRTWTFKGQRLLHARRMSFKKSPTDNFVRLGCYLKKAGI